MAESPNDRRERIAEALYVMMVGHCAAGGMTWSADRCAEQAREWADAFVAGVPEQPQPPVDASPSLLGMAKLIAGIDWAALFREAWCDDHHAGQVPPVVAAAVDNLRDAIAREEARRG